MIHIWHGKTQRVGHLGAAQDDFNLLGHVDNPDQLRTLTCFVNGQGAIGLAYRKFRRLAADGDFNADLPIQSLRLGDNTLTVVAEYLDGRMEQAEMQLRREEGDFPLPAEIRWAEVPDPQDVGQYVDGQWILTPDGLRTARTGYDRIFLIGNRNWQNYELTTTLTINRVDAETGPVSGGNGVGLLWRFQGHCTGGFRDFPEAQPKWGYLPFGAIGWMRWKKAGEGHPRLQFYPGDSNQSLDYSAFPAEIGAPYSVRMRCRNLEDAGDGSGVTRYSFRIWPAGQDEPRAWAWERLQISRHALRAGGCALLAHHVDATFGDLRIRHLEDD